jgi:hypothetical protein
MVSVGDARDSIERQLLGLGAPPNVAADVAVEVAMGLAGADSTPLPAAS